MSFASRSAVVQNSVRSRYHPAQRCAVDDAGVQAKPDDASGKLVHHHQYPMSSQRSGLTSEQVAAPQAVLRVAKKGEPGGTVFFGFGQLRLALAYRRPASAEVEYFHPFDSGR